MRLGAWQAGGAERSPGVLSRIVYVPAAGDKERPRHLMIFTKMVASTAEAIWINGVSLNQGAGRLLKNFLNVKADGRHLALDIRDFWMSIIPVNA